MGYIELQLLQNVALVINQYTLNKPLWLSENACVCVCVYVFLNIFINVTFQFWIKMNVI